jgi:signal transduction histidine kinase
LKVFAVSQTDITDLRRTESALRETIMALERERENKLMNVDAITASIAHEVKQPLTAIATNASSALRFSEKTPPDYDEVRAALNRVIRDSHRASEVFDSIRALFRKTDQAREPIDVSEITLEAVQSLRGELKDHGVTTHTELASELPLVEGQRRQLQQVIVNLVQNAIEAMDSTTDQSRVLRVRTKLRDRDAIIVAVEDTGPGINPKRLDGIFDAFVTTKADGMGLGLAICRTIIESHGGKISALSDGNSGTQFQFVLPIAPENTARS